MAGLPATTSRAPLARGEAGPSMLHSKPPPDWKQPPPSSDLSQTPSLMALFAHLHLDCPPLPPGFPLAGGPVSPLGRLQLAARCSPA